MPISAAFSATKASAFSARVNAFGSQSGSPRIACVISRLLSSASSRMTAYMDARGPRRRRECPRKGLGNGGGRPASVDPHRARLPFHARDDARIDDRVRRPRLDPAPPLRPLDARPGIAPAAALALAGAGALAFLPAAHREVVDVEARTVGLVLGLEVGLADVRAGSRIAAGVADERWRAVFQPTARRRALDAGFDPGPGLAARIAAAAVAAHEPRGRLEIGVVAARLVEAVDGGGGRHEKDEDEEEPGAAHGVSPRRCNGGRVARSRRGR